MYRKTYVEVNLDNIENNVQAILNKHNNYDYYFGVVKGCAYGHGAYIINSLIEKGINYLAISNLDEALEVRKYNKDIPVLCLEPIDVEFLDLCEKNNITITVSSYEYVNKIKDTNCTLKVHLKIDTGMNRLGFDDENILKDAYKILKKNKNISVEGIFTHMGSLGISDPFWDNQLSAFKRITSTINLKEIPIVHIDRSVTMMCHDKIEFCNGVRIGISLYGYNLVPVKRNGLLSTIRSLKTKWKIKKYNISKTNTDQYIDLKPALSLFSEVFEIKNVRKGEFIGYLGYVNNKEDFLVATIDIGYADGLDLRAKGITVVINGKEYKTIGTINMGMISVKVDENVKIGDKVEIIGENNSIRNYSSHVNTTIYEAMTRISPLLPRVYVKNNKVVKVVERMR